MKYVPGQPVLYIDSAKTSTLEGAATTVYAQGGKGNPRLISWEGEKTLTFTVEDALLSEAGLAILSGAGLLNAKAGNPIYVHQTMVAVVENGTIDLTKELEKIGKIQGNCPVFVMTMKDGSLVEKLSGLETEDYKITGITGHDDEQVFVDFYVEKVSGVTELTIDANNFAGYYYVEASTLFRRQADGEDMPAELIFPNVKIQSNFTFTMSSSGDPSTFTFTMDAMPGYTKFDRTKKVLCSIQIIDEDAAGDENKVDSTSTEASEEILYPNKVESVKVEYKDNSGNITLESFYVAKDSSIKSKVLEDANFLGWATTAKESSATIASGASTGAISEDTIYYAVFSAT